MSKEVSTVYATEGDLNSMHRTTEKAHTICGLRKTVFTAITLAALLCLGLGLGLGIGLPLKISNTAASAVSSPTSSSAIFATSFTTTKTTSIASTSSSTSPPKGSGTASTSCPSSNGTTYQASGHTFLIMCENDIQAANKVDLSRVYQPTFSACINTCAALDADKRADISAVYWVDYDSYDAGTCWCFGNTSHANGAVPSFWSANNLAWIQS